MQTQCCTGPSDLHTPLAHFLMVAVGSSGDVNPFLGIGVALGRRGHRVTLLSAPQFAGAAGSAGMGFVPLGSSKAYDAIYLDPGLWHPRHGLRVYFRYLSTLVEQTAEDISERYEPGSTAVLASFQCFGARVANEALGIPLCTVVPYPISLQSVHDPGRNPIGNPPRWMGRAGARLMHRVVNWEVSRHARPGVEGARRARGLSGTVRDIARWSFSRDSVLGLWPELFSRPQPDWPPNAGVTGFVSYDGPRSSGWRPPSDLPDRDDWLVFTPGTQMTHGAEYFRAACGAAGALGHPTLMVASDRRALPDELPSNVHYLGYAPFGWLFRRCALAVHHGGIGTTGRALEAGVPQLIVPRGFDQFDNARRATRLGVASTLDRRKLSAATLSSCIRELLSDEDVLRRCGEISAELAALDADEATCMAVERLLDSGPRGAS